MGGFGFAMDAINKIKSNRALARMGKDKISAPDIDGDTLNKEKFGDTKAEKRQPWSTRRSRSQRTTALLYILFFAIAMIVGMIVLM